MGVFLSSGFLFVPVPCLERKGRSSSRRLRSGSWPDGIRRVPAVVIDGQLADFYAARDLDEVTLTQTIFG